MAVVSRSREQRLQALEAANHSRFAGADVKRVLHGLPRAEAFNDAAQLLSDPPAALQALELHVFLMAIPGFGRERLREVCQRERVWPFRKIRDLTVNERARIAARLVRRPCPNPLSDRAIDLLDVICQEPGVTGRKLTGYAIMPAASVSGSLNGLSRRRLVERDGVGWVITSDGRVALEEARR